MSKSKLNAYFHSLFPIEKEVVKKITEKFSDFNMEKNTILLQKDAISTKTYFLEVGYMRSYIVNEDHEEITTNIFIAPCFVNDFLSFFQKQPIKETYQTITDCSFWETDLPNVQNNFHNIPDFREFSRLLFVMNYAKLHDRLIEMASEKAETRYMNLVKNKAALLQNVPLKVIASYLGITDSSLSRIRKDVGKL